MRGILPLAALVLTAAVVPRHSAAQVLMTQEEALEVAFPAPAEIERRTAFLDEEQLASIAEEAGSEPRAGIVTYYVGKREGEPLGVAYFDVHRVRTLPEVLMIVVGPRGLVQRLDVLRFAEPREYIAPDGWLALFEGRRLRGDLAEKNAVAGMTGATLTSRAVTGAVRRTLALHRLLSPFGEAAAAPRPADR